MGDFSPFFNADLYEFLGQVKLLIKDAGHQVAKGQMRKDVD
jgi:hypothetical protein